MPLPPLEWMEKVIRINSVTHESNEEIVAFLIPLLRDAGLQIAEHKVKEGNQTFTNLVAFSHAPDSPDLLVFNTHLDTVSPGADEAWTKTGGDPFRLTRVRDRLYGLGSADVKLDFLCKLWAAKKSGPWKRPIALVGSYGEERGLVGAGKLLEAHKVKPAFALVGEPSNLEIVYAHKGHLVCFVSTTLDKLSREKMVNRVWRGQAAHSSTPQLGINALSKALTDIFKRGVGIVSLNAGTNSNKVPDRCEADLVPQVGPANRTVFGLIHYLEETQKTLKKRRDPRFNPSVSTVSLNQAISQGDQLTLCFDIRTVPDVDLFKLRDKVEKDLTKMGWKIISMTVDAPLKGRKQSAFIEHASQTLKRCGVKKVVKATKASSTEAALYQMHGAQAIVFGPGISVGNVHRPNEFNLLSQMEVATRFYSALMAAPSGAF